MLEDHLLNKKQASTYNRKIIENTSVQEALFLK